MKAFDIISAKEIIYSDQIQDIGHWWRFNLF